MSDEIVEIAKQSWEQKGQPTLFSSFNKGLGTATPREVIQDAVIKAVGDFPGRFGHEWALKKYTSTGEDSDKEFGKMRQHLMNRVKAIMGTAGISCQDWEHTTDGQQFVAQNELAKLLIHFQRQLGSTDLDMFQFVDAFLVAALGNIAKEVVEDPATSLKCPKCSLTGLGWKSFVRSKDSRSFLCVECGTEVPENEACFRKIRKPVNQTYLEIARKMLGQFGPERVLNTKSLEQEPIQWIRANRVKLAPHLVRKIEMEYVNDLAESIKTEGILHPMTVRPLNDGFYEVVAGGHRFTALTSVLGWSKLPCIVRRLNADEAQLVGIAENIQRNVVLDPVREGEIFRALIEEKSWTIDGIAKRIGKKRYYVEERIRVFKDLAAPLKEELSEGKIAFKNAKWIAKHPQAKQIAIVGKLKRFPHVPKSTFAAPQTECTHSCPCHCPPT